MSDYEKDESVIDIEDVDGFLATLRRRFDQAVLDESEVRLEAKIDQLYASGEGQWSAEAIAQRKEERRPIKTFNLLPTFIQSVCNATRQEKPQPKVNPIGEGARQETARVLNGTIRHIQYHSKADIAYDGSQEAAATHSFGYFRFVTEESDDPTSFEQELVIKAVPDSFTVYGVLKPQCLGQRVPWAVIIERIPKDEFKLQYPDAKATTMDFRVDGLQDSVWLGVDDIQVAEYWWEETTKRKMLLLSDGTKGYSDEIGKLPKGVRVIRERDCLERKIRQCKTNGVEILGDVTEWVGDQIPIFGVYGKLAIVAGKIRLFSLIRFLRAPQESFNFIWCAILEKLSLANRVPYIGYKGQFKDPKWRSANTRNHAFLEVDELTIGGQPAPLPQRQQLEEQIVALANAATQIHDLMKAIVGIFDASLGAQGNEVSGTAIDARDRQSNVINLHFSDNLTRAEWDGCLALLDLIPKIYHEPGRISRIIGDDDTHSTVVLNMAHIDEKGKPQHYDLSKGKYDVVVTPGKSYADNRMEAAATLGELFKAEPTLFPILGDMWLRSLDYPWSEEGAARVKKMLPLALQEDASGQNIPPAVKAKLQQTGQVIDQLTAQVHQMAQEIEAKQFELQSKERIVAMQENTKLSLGIAALDQKDGLALLEQEVAALRSQFDNIHAASLQDAAQQHEAGMQAADHAHQAGLQQAQQAHAADTQVSDQQHQAAQAEQAQQAQAGEQG